MNHKKAILLTVCVAVLWSLAGLNIKMISWPPYAIAGDAASLPPFFYILS